MKIAKYIKLSIALVAISIAVVSCIENDIPYPRIQQPMRRVCLFEGGLGDDYLAKWSVWCWKEYACRTIAGQDITQFPV